MGGLAGLLGGVMDATQRVTDRRQLAEMAAQSFDQIGGDQASYWAKSLRANPRVAWEMARQYGGVGEIEMNLRGSEARGRAASGADIAGLFKQSPEDYKTFAEGDLAFAKAGGERADAANTRAIFGGGNGIGGGVGGVQGLPMNASLEYRMALASGDPGKVRAARDRIESMNRTDEEQLAFLKKTDPSKAKQFRDNLRSLDPESIRKLQGTREKQATGVQAVFEVRSRLDQMTDFEDPRWEFSMAVELNKALQPDSAVLLSEAQVLYDNLISELEKAGLLVGGVVKATGRLDTAGREKLWNMAVDLTDAGMDQYKKLNKSWKKQNDEIYEFDPATDIFTRPGSEYLSRIDEKVGKGRPKPLTLKPRNDEIPEGATGVNVDPRTGEKTQVIMVNGTWIEAR